MKWTNRGHQLDELGKRYLKVKNLYLYGIDEKAKKAYDLLQWLGVADEFNISFVLDSTVFNHESERAFCGKRVIPFQTELCDEVRAAPEECVVALPWIAQSNEREILEQLGPVGIFYLTSSYNRRDNFVQNFVCVWLMYRHEKLLSHWTNFVTTLKCNRNCKYCLNYYEYIENPQDVSFEAFKDHFDTVFSKFDYLYSLHFTGGEPLLVKELPRFIRYLEENYKDRIFEFFIITNSTMIPNPEIISAVKSLNGHFLLDDYSNSDSHSKIKEIKAVLTDNDVAYVVNSPTHWFDLDIQNADNSNLEQEELECYKDSCNSYLQEFAENKIYACCYQQYANRAGLLESTTNDYIEIADTPKMEILEFRQGYTLRGYVDLCKHCRGIGDNHKKVAPAIQIPRNSKDMQPEQPKQTIIQKNTVSICVPVYNTEKYLVRCIKSLLAQTYQNIEIILVNDGSTDSCGLICDEYAKLDTRVVAVHKVNGGEASARNAGVRAARGEYIMFCDSDDEYLPDAVALMIDAIKLDDVDFVIGGYLEKSGQAERFATAHVRRYSVKEAVLNYLQSECNYGIKYTISTVNGKLFRRDIISDNSIAFDERFVVGNDMLFVCGYLQYARDVYNVFAPVYVYYKYHAEERVQGMAWYYPDTFFFFAYVADKMLMLAQLDENECKRIIGKQYIDFLYGLLYATANEEHFPDGLTPHLESLCDKIELIQTGAKLHLAADTVREEPGSIPTKIISYLIVHKKFKELHELMRALAKARNMSAYKGEHVRQMIRDIPTFIEERSLESTSNLGSTSILLPSFNYSIAEDRYLLKQLSDMINSIATKDQQISVCQQQLETSQQQLETSQQQLEESRINYETSTSWRVTRPLRALKRFLRR
jgi:glycosyltransferase involved in cell wall biosynthesis/organic radical activating enzyme